jgi:hypothetical protein
MRFVLCGISSETALTLSGWKKWEGGGRKFNVTRKMYRGIEKGTKTVGIRAILRARTE